MMVKTTQRTAASAINAMLYSGTGGRGAKKEAEQIERKLKSDIWLIKYYMHI